MGQGAIAASAFSFKFVFEVEAHLPFDGVCYQPGQGFPGAACLALLRRLESLKYVDTFLIYEGEGFPCIWAVQFIDDPLVMVPSAFFASGLDHDRIVTVRFGVVDGDRAVVCEDVEGGV